jgi:hypothetical protein
MLAAEQRVDWPGVILDIQRSTWLADKQSGRMSLEAIATACGRGYSWAWSLKNIPATEPRFHDGLLLLGLWSDKTAKAADALPLYRESNRTGR